MKHVSETYRKLRNSLRFIIGSLDGYQSDCTFELSALPHFDQYALYKLYELSDEVKKCYDQFDFMGVTILINNFLTLEMSAYYLDIIKDRLYISESNEFRRKTCQFVLAQMLQHITVMLAPITPHLSEDIWQHVTHIQHKTKSVFHVGWQSHWKHKINMQNVVLNSYFYKHESLVYKYP